jgi:hypothetical protein
LTIESIFRQSKGLSGVFLWLASTDAHDLPKSLVRLIKRGLSVVVVKEDVKSYKKLVYCRQIPDWQYVITADDDVFYPKNWAEMLSDETPEASTLIRCLRAQVMQFFDNGAPLPYASFQLATSSSPRSLLLPTGVSGISYPRGALTDELENTDVAQKLCPNADDVWFRFATQAAGYNVSLAFPDSCNFTPTTFPWAEGLYKSNITTFNDVAIANAIAFFSDRRTAQ